MEHSVPRQLSSQLQKYKAARLTRRIAVDQKIRGWDGGHQGLRVSNLLTTKELKMCIQYSKKFRFILCGCYM